jgi:hypothetical protein
MQEDAATVSRQQQERARVVVAVGWATLVALAVLYVANFGVNAPYADEWEFVPVLVGAEPWWSALWQQHNEHRLPLTRAVYLAIFRWTRDFRSGSFLQIVLLAGLSLWLMRQAAQWRGRSDWADLFFPLTLLHPGHWENWLMGYQVGFAVYTVLAVGLAVALLWASQCPSAARLSVVGGLILLTAASGGFGLPLAVLCAAWLGYCAVVLVSDRPGGLGQQPGAVLGQQQRRRAVWLALGCGAVLSVYLVAYFGDYQAPPRHPPWHSAPGRVVRVAAQVLALSWGIAAAAWWWLAAVAVMAWVGVVVGYLWRQRPVAVERTALTAWCVGQVALAVAIGVGRGGFGADMGLWPRYSLLAWPLLGVCFLWSVRWQWRTVTRVACLVAAFFWPDNFSQGWHRGSQVWSYYQALAHDAAAGMPTELLIQRHFPGSFNEHQHARAVRAIPLLRAAHIGIFAPPVPQQKPLEVH